MAALDMYVEREQWEKCLETAAKQVAVGSPASRTHIMSPLALQITLSPGHLLFIKASKKLATDL